MAIGSGTARPATDDDAPRERGHGRSRAGARTDLERAPARSVDRDTAAPPDPPDDGGDDGFEPL